MEGVEAAKEICSNQGNKYISKAGLQHTRLEATPAPIVTKGKLYYLLYPVLQIV